MSSCLLVSTRVLPEIVRISDSKEDLKTSVWKFDSKEGLLLPLLWTFRAQLCILHVHNVSQKKLISFTARVKVVDRTGHVSAPLCSVRHE